MLDRLYDHACMRCPLGPQGPEYEWTCVGGDGDYASRALVVGEAPGRNEAERGEPFVGDAGSVLNDALARAGISWRDVFTTNAVKCRPPSNRKPERIEEDACRVYLERELRVVDPVAAMALGNHALRALTGLWGITAHVGSWKRVPRSDDRDDLLVLPNYHPAYVLRNPPALSTFEEVVSEYVKTWRYACNHSVEEAWAYASP